jgi:Mn2+/Fe2+ NRAMP family transporter
MSVCFAVLFGISKPDAGELVKGWLLPYCASSVVIQAVGTLGAVVMPHNLYLHSALVQSRAIDRSNRPAVAEANLYNTIESSLSLLLSYFINMFVVCVFAAGFFGTPDADSIGLREAGTVLGAKYGDAVMYIWAVGLLAAGQSSTMTGTLAGQYVMQGFIKINVSPWVRVMITRSIAIIPAVIVAVSSTRYLDTLDEWLNVVQSIQLPFAVLPLIIFSQEPALMGEFVIGRKTQFTVWVIFFAIGGINIYLVQDFASKNISTSVFATFMFILLGGLYFGFLGYLMYRQLVWVPKNRGPLLLADGASASGEPQSPMADSSAL